MTPSAGTAGPRPHVDLGSEARRPHSRTEPRDPDAGRGCHDNALRPATIGGAQRRGPGGAPARARPPGFRSARDKGAWDRATGLGCHLDSTPAYRVVADPAGCATEMCPEQEPSASSAATTLVWATFSRLEYCPTSRRVSQLRLSVRVILWCPASLKSQGPPAPFASPSLLPHFSFADCLTLH